MTSGSPEFDKLRKKLIADKDLRREVEFAFSALLGAANPSDRGLRFLFGNGAEWIMAATAWEAGILTAPAGHNQNGFDLGDLLDKARGIWSVKASASKSAGQIRLKNFMGDGSNATWDDTTLFVSPYLGGAAVVDPKVHIDVAGKVNNSGDALTIGGGAIKTFAKENPENFVAFDVAENLGQTSGDPYAFIKSIIKPELFPRLAKPFLAAQPVKNATVVDEIQQLVELKQDGVLTEEQLKTAISQMLDQ